MHIAVTGASGRVGRSVVSALAERGHHVIGLDLVPPKHPVPGAEYIVGDLADLPDADPRLHDVEAVAHLGALMSWDPVDADRLFAANVMATERLVRAVDGSAVRRFVLGSSGEVYPENDPVRQPIDERHPRLPQTWYGLSKVLAEEIVAFAGRTNDWATVVLRFAHTQDPGELLDPESFFSGPRFFASRRIAKERAAGHDGVVAALESYADDDETLLIAHREDGAPVQMGILATADLTAGIVLALEASTTGHEVIGLGPDESTDLGVLASELAAAAGLGTVDVTLPVTAPSYTTSNDRARELLGFRPTIDRGEFVRQAVAAREARRAGV
ncbi:NAD(P)-dependent oxidoreductase [Curtobacterium pusillum]|uniref:NAD(P)-dependent oxidoreductase n=1 Tax=Curtobacterium pusillum TaxID=69373 RepID=A0ABX2M429_9MICO|nr:NAD(P)-dependent oxidoreductase [Curtobacterium pusillum]NUU12670.1 NAD(P)-dependent oxidoreductase [Curtobacterium pusillum]GLK33064.1 nucleoside-diphosphate sugar epimerase [Curtobacterium pusillum]